MWGLDRIVQQLKSSQSRAWLHGCDTVGADVRLLGRPCVRNLGRMEIGSGLIFSSIPVRSHLITGPHGTLQIGDRVQISHGASISVQTRLVISDDAVIGPLVMILDSNYHDPNNHDSPGATKPIHIGRGVVLGAGVVVLLGAVIGDGAVIAPNSVVNRHIPPGVHASGVPARPDRPRLLRAS